MAVDPAVPDPAVPDPGVPGSAVSDPGRPAAVPDPGVPAATPAAADAVPGAAAPDAGAREPVVPGRDEPTAAPLLRHPVRDLVDTVGGPAALIDSALPTVVFALTFTLGHRHLLPALIAAVATAVVLAGWRLVRREPVQTVLGGVLAIALAAGVALVTGRASDYYLLSVVRALGLAAIYAVSAIIGWPIIGVLVGAAAGRPGGFREDPAQLRAYTRVTWLWVGLFLLRLAVRGPLLLANQFTWLSVTDVVMGWPLFLAWTALTYVLLRRWLHGSVWQAAHEGIVARNSRTAARRTGRGRPPRDVPAEPGGERSDRETPVDSAGPVGR